MSLNNARKSVSGGGKVCGKPGHDSNLGTADEPIRSISALSTTASSVSVLLAGYYKSVVTGPALATNQMITINCDGLVVIDLQNIGTVSPRVKINDAIIINGIWGDGTNNSNVLFEVTGNTYKRIFGVYSTGANDTGVKLFTNCKFLFGELLSPRPVNHYRMQLKGAIIDGGGVYQVQQLVNSFVDFSSVVQFTMAASGAVPSINDAFLGSSATSNRFTNNNINGLVRLPITGGAWQDYAIQDQYTGTPQDNGYAAGVHWLNESNLTSDGYIGTVSGWDTVVATMINRDPKFINQAVGNYNLQVDSPHIKGGFNGSDNIGSTNIGDTTLFTDNGIGTTTIILSPEIDDTVPSALKLKTGETEGYIRQIKFYPRTIERLKIDGPYFFDSDDAGNTPFNNNVADAEPLSTDYAVLENTIASGSSTQFIVDNSSTIAIGLYCRIAGEGREITNVEANTPTAGQKRVTVASAFRGTIGSGVEVTWGTQPQIAVLNPNRLTVLMRTSSNPIGTPPNPSVGSDWDNGVDPGYGVVGDYFNQEIFEQPLLWDVLGTIYGGGDSNRPTGGSSQTIGNCWVDMIIYIRQDFNHKGK